MRKGILEHIPLRRSSKEDQKWMSFMLLTVNHYYEMVWMALNCNYSSNFSCYFLCPLSVWYIHILFTNNIFVPFVWMLPVSEKSEKSCICPTCGVASSGNYCPLCGSRHWSSFWRRQKQLCIKYVETPWSMWLRAIRNCPRCLGYRSRNRWELRV